METYEKRRPGRRRRRRSRALKITRLILTDLLFIALGLNAFALHHVVLASPEKTAPMALPTAELSPTPTAEPTPAPETTEEPTEEPAEDEPSPEPTPTRVYSGVWGEKFAEHFTEGEVIADETSYRSENISITVTEVEEDGLLYHIADVYISDLKYLRAGLGNGVYWAGTQATDEMARANDALVAISGDHYTGRLEGVVVRNGVLYRETRFADVCILGNDGVLRTVTDEEFDLEAVKEEGAWQVWSFGPMLLQDGRAMTEFNSELTRANPRSAIGYYEPGHYCLVQVDGRIDRSRGMTLEELSQLFETLGCTAAYNLDGGQSSGFAWQGELLSYPYGRKVSDIIYIAEVPEDGGESTEGGEG